MNQIPHRARGTKKDPKVELKQKIKRAQLRNDLAETFATPHGKRALRFIMDMCGFHSSSIVGNPQTGDVHDRGTLYNEARRNVYLELRDFLPIDIKRDVELGNLEPPDIEDL